MIAPPKLQRVDCMLSAADTPSTILGFVYSSQISDNYCNKYAYK